MTTARQAWPWIALAAVLFLQLVWRAHTFGDVAPLRPLVRAGLVAGGEIEPLDCDESIYAYMGRRMTQGDVLYVDLSENKPPLGYWLYGLTVALGGANEWAIRLMPLPFVLATTALVFGIARRLAGNAAGATAAFLFALTSTDPYLFGNGANLEHEMNFFAVAGLGLFLKGRELADAPRLIGSGACLAAASLVKQTAVAPILLFVAAIATTPGSPRSRIRSLAAFLGGFGLLWAVCLGVLLIQGNLREGFEHFVTWAMALSRETPPDMGAPPAWMRWLTGNADPKGILPWPFGRTDYLVWWGTGAWPLWPLFPFATIGMIAGPGASPSRRFVGLWTLAAAVEVVLSGLYWQHYYLLPVPGLAICAACWAFGPRARRWLRALAVGLLLVATLATIRIQVRDYWLVTPDQLTTRYKGGGQWVALRKIGRDLRARTDAAKLPPALYVWGWQSPLYLYGEFDAPSRYAFADPLLKALSGKDHPLIRPRLEQIMADLNREPPTLIFVADPPFPAMRAFLRDRYVISWSSGIPAAPDGRGLWVLQSAYAAYERAGGHPLPGL